MTLVTLIATLIARIAEAHRRRLAENDLRMLRRDAPRHLLRDIGLEI